MFKNSNINGWLLLFFIGLIIVLFFFIAIKYNNKLKEGTSCIDENGNKGVYNNGVCKLN